MLVLIVKGGRSGLGWYLVTHKGRFLSTVEVHIPKFAVNKF